jgi:hypothetical protein
MRLLQKLENRKNDRNSGAMASAQKPKSFLQKLSSFKPSSLKQRNKEVGDAFKQQILSSGVTAEQLIAASPEIQNFEYSEQAAGLAIGARLVYECAPNISAKAAHVTNDQGMPYLVDRGSKISAWDAAVEDYLQLDKLYAAQHESGFQLASYYDQKNKNDQEKIFMEALIQENPALEIIKREYVKPTNDLPKSCFKIFKDGLINNLMEMVKCFGAKR